MIHAIKAVGLDYHLVHVEKDIYTLKSVVLAYLKAGIPLIFIYKVIKYDSATLEGKVYANHAVTITGYEEGDLKFKEDDSYKFYSRNLNKIYVHDDQVGPFSCMEFYNKKFKIDGYGGTLETLSTLFKPYDEESDLFCVLPNYILIPHYEKIRIPFNIIENATMYFNVFVIENFPEYLEVDKCDIFWDIYLITVNNLKNEILKFEFKF